MRRKIALAISAALAAATIAQVSRQSPAPTPKADPVAIIKQAMIDLPAKDDPYPGWHSLKRDAESAMEAMKLPVKFKAYREKMTALMDAKDYAKAIPYAEVMYEMLPEKHSTEYPLSDDFRSEWLAGIGDLKLYIRDYEGAKKTYTAALDLKPMKVSLKQAGHQAAAYGLSYAYTLTGDRVNSRKWLEKAPGYYWSGCGNCLEGERVSVHRLDKILYAFTQPDPAAEGELLAIISGHFPTIPTELGGSPESQIQNARIQAAFMLGEHYQNRAKPELAKLCFELVAKKDSWDPWDAMAEARLKSLP